MKNFKVGILFFLITTLFTSCSLFDDDDAANQNVVIEGNYIVDAEFLGSFQPSDITIFTTAATIKSLIGETPSLVFLTKYHSRLRYRVNAYKITYNTIDTEGNSIVASGALLIPQTIDALPLVSQQHGTLRDATNAPSFLTQNSEVYVFGLLYSSMGHVFAAPDYLGYGESSQIAHPYEHAPSLATASRDMIRASREFCAANNVNLNEKLFLTGYSEGGNATMALHQLLEEEHSDEFTITASAPGAGAYNKLAFTKAVASENQTLDFNFMVAYIWVVWAYNSISSYNLNRTYTDYFQEPNATTISNAPVAGTPQIQEGSINTNPQQLFTNNFLNGILNETDTDFVNALKDNDVYDWKPVAPMRMFHGTADDFVYPLNSETAFAAMQARGATNVEYFRMEGKDHITGQADFIDGAIEYFDTFQ